jgi:hypothetical protein
VSFLPESEPKKKLVLARFSQSEQELLVRIAGRLGERSAHGFANVSVPSEGSNKSKGVLRKY